MPDILHAITDVNGAEVESTFTFGDDRNVTTVWNGIPLASILSLLKNLIGTSARVTITGHGGLRSEAGRKYTFWREVVVSYRD